MNKIALFLAAILAVGSCGKVFAQQKTVSMEMVDEKPRFQDGDDNAFISWVYKELKYPDQAISEKLAGKVTIKFVISKNGDVRDVKILDGVHPALDAEAMRVISMSPKWSPGKVKGMPVDVAYVLPVIFNDQNKSVTSADMDVIPAVFYSPYKKAGTNYSSSVEFTKWIFMNIEYPKEAKEKSIMGQAIVAFDILESGEVVNVRIVKSAHPLLDEELVRVVRTSPRWKAATQNGQPVRTTCTLPFRFLLR